MLLSTVFRWKTKELDGTAWKPFPSIFLVIIQSIKDIMNNIFLSVQFSHRTVLLSFMYRSETTLLLWTFNRTGLRWRPMTEISKWVDISVNLFSYIQFIEDTLHSLWVLLLWFTNISNEVIHRTVSDGNQT